jgi:tetratricopeptide (TPR) repeat protein
MAAGLRIANQRRETIVEGLGKPLLWCGPEEFLTATWERAPDLWSIRGMTHRVIVPASAPPEAPLWAGAVVRDAPERLRATLDRAREQGDAAMLARVSAQLAEALLAAGEFAEAAEVIDAVAAEAQDGETALLEARAAYALGDATRARAALESAKERRRAPYSHETITTGNLLLRDGTLAAKAAYAGAVSSAQSERDARSEAVAIANQGIAELALGEASDACILHLGRVHAALFDAHVAAACFEEALEMVRAQADTRGEARVLCHLARAYLETGDAEKAREDATRALGLAKQVGDERLVARATAVIEAAS